MDESFYAITTLEKIVWNQRKNSFVVIVLRIHVYLTVKYVIPRKIMIVTVRVMLD